MKSLSFKLLSMILIAGIIIVIAGGFVSAYEWRNVSFVEPDMNALVEHVGTYEKTVKINPNLPMIDYSVKGSVDFLVDNQLPDDEVKVKVTYDQDQYGNFSAYLLKTRNKVEIDYQSRDNHDIENMKKALALIKEKKIPLNLTDLKVQYIVNEKNREKMSMWRNREKSEGVSGLPGVSYDDYITVGGQEVYRKVYNDGRMSYVYENGYTEMFEPDKKQIEKEAGPIGDKPERIS